MSEDLARALGAGGSRTVRIGGKDCTSRPLSIRELAEVERDCVERYKRQYLQTFAKNLDLLPDGQGAALLERKMEQVARWDVGDLPTKAAHEAKRVRVTPELKAWFAREVGIEEPEDAPFPQDKWQGMTSSVLDQGVLTAAEYERLTGTKPPRVQVPYVSWWISGSFEGMITMVWVCFKHNGVTRDEVIEALAEDKMKLAEVAREIGTLSAPSVGNG